jgi:hypothetical protein
VQPRVQKAGCGTVESGRGRDIAIAPKSEREREALRAAERLRNASSRQEAHPIIFGLSEEVMFDFGFSRDDLSKLDPAKAAARIVDRIKALKAVGYLGRQIGGPDGTVVMSNPGGRSRDGLLILLLAAAFEEFARATGEWPKLTPNKLGMLFLAAVLEAADRSIVGLKGQAAHVLNLLRDDQD